MSNMLPPTFLTDWQADFPEACTLLAEAGRDAAARRARLTLAEAPLSIGVMGQVKAGKSSFLNSLLFGGQALLPEAATPKTANLTRIRYAEKPRFTAHFYKPEDWALIEQQAAGNSPDEASRAARELVESARASGDDIPKLLAQGSMLVEAEDLGGLLGKLNDFTGSDGRLTALVAETELALPLEQLKGIEIVDTPGMNDPVVSRTHKTREYMALCDVVFFLSRSSQFLDASDQGLMSAQLPSKGIKRLILVGAQFDMAVLDDGFNRKSLEACTSRLYERLGRHAGEIFNNLASMREKQDMPEAAALLRNTGAPIFASTHAWQIAHKPQQEWSGAVRHTHQELDGMAGDCWKTPLTNADWAELANWEPLTAALEQALTDKEHLLAQQRAGLEKELTAQQADLLRQLREQAEARMTALQQNDLQSLAQREQRQQAQVDKISTALANFLRATVTQTHERQRELLEEIAASAQRAGQVQERTGYKRVKESFRVSDSKWYNPFTWGDHHYESYSTTTSYSYLAVSDALENLGYYVTTAKRQMLAAFDDLIAPSTVSAGLRRELLRAIDPSSADFDPKGLRALVESSLTSLKLPALDFAEPDLESTFSGFSGEIKDSIDMARLRDKLSTEVRQINDTLVSRLQQAVRETSQTLEGIAGQLHDRLTERLADDIARLRADMADKEKQIARLQKLMTAIAAA
ncbi:dynamin family protein [Limnohabitans sp.]|uniref:dynamin family protein n=1 Tax=Limnohabitans sp. TaxID=1907725 RepID=UPI0035AF26A0